MSYCDKAEAIVKYAGEQDAAKIIEACCGNGEARPCLQYLSEMGAKYACMAQTSNACEPCCSYVAGVVAEVFVTLLYESGLGGVVEDFWELGTAIVGSVLPQGSCDFDPARNAAVQKAEQAVKAQAEALRVAWVGVHGKLGRTLPSWAEQGRRVPVKLYQGGVMEFRPYAYGGIPTPVIETATWTELLLNRAQVLPLNINAPWNGHYRDVINVAQSSWGEMHMNPVEISNRSLSAYMHVSFSHWRCDRSQQFGESLSRALNARLRGIGQAREYFTKRIGIFYTNNHEPLDRSPEWHVAPMERTATSPVGVIALAAILVGSAYAATKIWKG